MASFHDTQGREWELQLDGPTIFKIRQECDPNFLLKDDDTNNTAQRLSDDPALLCFVIYLLCAKQRELRHVSQEDFYLKVIGDGESIQAAGEALQRAIENFTRPRKREFISAIAAKQREVEDLAMQEALARLNDPTLMAKIKQSLTSQIDAAIDSLTRQPSAADSLDSSASHPSA